MKFIKSIKSIFKKFKSRQVETIIITEKQCPHCTSRGMFIFNSYTEIKTKPDKINENIS